MNKHIFLVISMFAIFCSVIRPSWAQENPQNSIKVTLLSLGSGSARFTYERAIDNTNSVEFTLGVIGWGWDVMNDADPSGILIKTAYKYNLLPLHDMALAGLYSKSEFVYADFDYIDPEMNSNATQHVSRCAILEEFGYQLIVKWFTLDVYAGLGPTFGSSASNNYYHSFMLFPVKSHLAFTAGFRIGVAF